MIKTNPFPIVNLYSQYEGMIDGSGTYSGFKGVLLSNWKIQENEQENNGLVKRLYHMSKEDEIVNIMGILFTISSPSDGQIQLRTNTSIKFSKPMYSFSKLRKIYENKPESDTLKAHINNSYFLDNNNNNDKISIEGNDAFEYIEKRHSFGTYLKEIRTSKSPDFERYYKNVIFELSTNYFEIQNKKRS